jgi:WD40 repeat protein
MKIIAVLMMSVVGIMILPAVSFIDAGNKECAGAQIPQDSQPKKPSFADPALELEIKHETGVTAIAYSPDNKILAVGADDYTIQLLDAGTGQVWRRLDEPDRGARAPGVHLDGQRVYSLAFSPDGKTLASAGDIIKNNMLAGGHVTLWEVSSGKLLRTIIVNQRITTYTKSAAFTPDGKRLVTGMARYAPSEVSGRYTETGEINEWDAQTGSLERKWEPLDSGINSVTFSPDGQFLVAGRSDSTINFWDIKTRELRRTLPGNSRLFSLCFSPDGRTLASCVGPDLPAIAGQIEPLMKAHLWDIETGRSEMTTISHSGFVTAVAFSPDGRCLASGDEGLYSTSSHRREGGTVKIWRLK